MNAGTCWEQEYNRPIGLSVEKAPKSDLYLYLYVGWVGCWRFGALYRFHLQRSGFLRSLKMGRTCCPATSVNNYKPASRNIAEERGPQLHLGGSLKPRIPHLVVTLFSDGSFMILGVAYIILCISKKIYSVIYLRSTGHTVAQLVEVLRYKFDSRGFDSRLCHCNLTLT